MINLDRFYQIKKNKKIMGLQLQQANELGTDSFNKKKEIAGTFKFVFDNNTNRLTLVLELTETGGISSVDIPEKGNTFHTHPRQCPSSKNCSIIPPSSTDMKIFAERCDDQHVVITLERVYWIKAAQEYDYDDALEICKFFEILEEDFNENSYMHGVYDRLFVCLCRMSKFFIIYQFKNQSEINF